MSYILSLDQGTTSSRAILFDQAGAIAAAAQKEFPQIYPQPGWVEHDPMEILTTQMGCAVEALGKVGARARDVARGVCQFDSNRYLTDVVEMLKIEPDGAHAKNTAADGSVTALDGSEPVSMNMWAFQPSIFPLLQTKFLEFMQISGTELKSECLIPNTVNELVKAAKARVKVLHTNDSWFGVTYREDQPSVVANIRALIAAGKYPEKLWK